MPAKVTNITDEGVELIYQDKKKFVPADFVFILTGFHPNVELFYKWGIEINDDLSISLTETHEICSFPGVYVIGAAGYGRETNKVFIENGREHAVIAIKDISTKLKLKN